MTDDSAATRAVGRERAASYRVSHDLLVGDRLLGLHGAPSCARPRRIRGAGRNDEAPALLAHPAPQEDSLERVEEWAFIGQD